MQLPYLLCDIVHKVVLLLLLFLFGLGVAVLLFFGDQDVVFVNIV